MRVAPGGSILAGMSQEIAQRPARETADDDDRSDPPTAYPSRPEPTALDGIEEEGVRYDVEGPAPTGIEVIASYVKTLPDAPGVYRMLDPKGQVLYVGKARSLKKRVANYANMTGHTTRILRMILSTASMVFVRTETETEALLLEANLIKQLKPRFNVLLRDDKSFPHIQIKDGPYPQIAKHRGAKSEKGDYFGPFASAGAVNRTINQLQKAFLLRNCSDSMFENRTRPCLLYQIKRCAGPCVGLVTEEAYAALVADAKRFLTGKSTKVQAELAEKMSAASAEMAFERAAAYRDRIRALTQIQAHQGVNPQGVAEADVVAMHGQSGQTCIQVFFFRSGQNWGNKAYFPRTLKDCSDEEILEAFLGQFYTDKTPPRLLLLSHETPQAEMIAAALSTIAGRKVEILVPKRGEKKTLVDHALSNARESLGRKVAENAAQGKLLAGVADAFGLDQPPRRIEVYDNSHIMGTNAVGGMIVAGPEGFLKSQYRKFNIKAASLTPAPVRPRGGPLRPLGREPDDGAVDQELALAGIDLDGRAVAHRAVEDQACERVLERPLDGALQGPGAIDRIVAGVGEPGLGLVRELELDLALGEEGAEAPELDLDDPPHVLA